MLVCKHLLQLAISNQQQYVCTDTKRINEKQKKKNLLLVYSRCCCCQKTCEKLQNCLSTLIQLHAHSLHLLTQVSYFYLHIFHPRIRWSKMEINKKIKKFLRYWRCFYTIRLTKSTAVECSEITVCWRMLLTALYEIGNIYNHSQCYINCNLLEVECLQLIKKCQR